MIKLDQRLRDVPQDFACSPFPPPDFDTALQRSQQFIRISVWLLRLKPFQQFS
jgi:hypothetical protein